MDSAAKILEGFQLSLVPDIAPSPISNPSSPEQEFEIGDVVKLRDRPFYHSSRSYQTGTIDTSNIPKIGYGIRLGNGAQTWYTGEWLELANQPDPRERPGRKRRHSKKGQASGWIEERWGNKARKRQSLSLYYCWEESVEGERRRYRSYIPANQCQQIAEMVRAGKPCGEIAATIRKRGS
ncbi:MAG TPA: hypothetical protein V6D18_09860 [Thermosynechococcaceae cyanobacterium]